MAFILFMTLFCVVVFVAWNTKMQFIPLACRVNKCHINISARQHHEQQHSNSIIIITIITNMSIVFTRSFKTAFETSNTGRKTKQKEKPKKNDSNNQVTKVKLKRICASVWLTDFVGINARQGSCFPTNYLGSRILVFKGGIFFFFFFFFFFFLWRWEAF